MKKLVVSPLAVSLALLAPQAFADHPLISEDAELAGKGHWQIQLHGEQARDEENGSTTRASHTELELTYGIREDADLKISLPYLR